MFQVFISFLVPSAATNTTTLASAYHLATLAMLVSTGRTLPPPNFRCKSVLILRAGAGSSCLGDCDDVGGVAVTGPTVEVSSGDFLSKANHIALKISPVAKINIKVMDASLRSPCIGDNACHPICAKRVPHCRKK